ncbi:Signal transduction histidine-protein kinase AtoS [Emticicia aquatica]|uniref:histidine kinase n=1 Tax=Emticicia aquatica TaxID=1681835 RepID=A0ABN8EY68_9BACT|nr:HAMP domain-containing sensor histidine kinase [Emticicia aquatica]CAH0996788.1 Signal transduction histidine-protein kinase AtoS [Emticicia aquatica]
MKHFSIGILWRLCILSLILAGEIYFFLQKQWFPAFISMIFVGIIFFSIFTYVTSINRKLARFFESVRYSDFTVKFRADNKLGKSFEEVNQQLNGVLDAFRQARAEKEANLHYINTIVQHVNVGLLSFDSLGNIELINNAAFRTLNLYRLRNISELNNSIHVGLFEILKNLPSGSKTLYETSNEQQITINSTTVSLRGRVIKLVSLQNIQSELQEKELDAWQNLTKVLRHEIMNSVTPIVSLASTMREIIEIDLSDKIEIKETIDDLKEALQTIENRSKGIMNFVNAYREFTTIPKPIFQETTSKALISHLLNLVQPQIKEKRISLVTDFKHDFTLLADTDHIEMVLINLVKNAIEAVESKLNPVIKIRTYQSDNQRFIEISDNGSGIEPEALEKIFIPFYTTKKTGSGIGLSLSRQIMQMHGGNLKVFSKVGEGSKFLVIF